LDILGVHNWIYCPSIRVARLRKYIPIYEQQDAALHSLFISGNCCTCFGWYLHPSSGAQTVSRASGIRHTVMDRIKFTDKVYIKIRLKLINRTYYISAEIHYQQQF
jgi:hypothetical protein